MKIRPVRIFKTQISTLEFWEKRFHCLRFSVTLIFSQKIWIQPRLNCEKSQTRIKLKLVKKQYFINPYYNVCHWWHWFSQTSCYVEQSHPFLIPLDTICYNLLLHYSGTYPDITRYRGTGKMFSCCSFSINHYYLHIPGWGLLNGPSLIWVTPNNRNTAIHAMRPLKSKDIWCIYNEVGISYLFKLKCSKHFLYIQNINVLKCLWSEK